MMIIYSHNIPDILLHKLNTIYLIVGKNEFFIQFSEKILLKYAKKKFFYTKKEITITSNEQWKQLISIYSNNTIFSEKTIIICQYTLNIFEKDFLFNFKKISNLSNPNILLIIKLNYIVYINYNINILNIIKKKSIIIFCNALLPNQYINWINYIITKKKLNIHQDSKKYIYKNYEGNLFELSNILNILKLLYPSTLIKINDIKNIVENLAIFTPQQWIDAILKNKKKQSINIIHRLSQQKYDPIILIRTLQKDLLILIYMIKNKSINLNIFFKEKKICSSRHIIFINACKKYTIIKLYKVIKIITCIELKIKEKYNNKTLWILLKKLTLQF
ncbi:DNA polymerase III subunit delta [Buchnera aphidicola]|uniref:DNA polymerase III subunit delta n=1 Tax=Buchnera aphidicola TaxID=9 RepID=UPI0031B81DF7